MKEPQELVVEEKFSSLVNARASASIASSKGLKQCDTKQRR